MATNVGDFPVDNIGYLRNELIEEREVEDSAHYLPSPRPLLPLGEGHSLPEEPDLIFNKLGLLHIIFLLLKELLEEMRVDNEQEALVEGVEDEVPGLRVGLKRSL